MLHLTDQCVISLRLTASSRIDQYSPCYVPISNILFITNAAELHLSGLIGTASHPICRKSGYLDFSLKTGYIGSLKFGCYYLQ